MSRPNGQLVIRPLAIVLVALAISGPSPAMDRALGSPARGVIRGRVDVARALPPIERRPSVGALATPPATFPVDRRQSVIYLEAGPRGAFEAEERRARMDQRNETFVPRLLAVTTGTTVDFPNNDRTFHNVFSLSKVKRFDLGRYAAGSSKGVRFDRPGIVRVFCDIHSHMNAFILVFGHQHFALTDPTTGGYRLPDLPPGSYVVAIWHESLGADPQPVTVPVEGGDLDVNFKLERR